MRVLRAEYRLTQHDIAWDLKVLQSRVSLIENGFMAPTEDEKKKLAKIFKTTIEEVFPAMKSAEAVA